MEEDLQKIPQERPLGRIPFFTEQCETIRECDLNCLATKRGNELRNVIGSRTKRTLQHDCHTNGCTSNSDGVLISSLMTHAEAKLAATLCTKRIELILDEKAPTISEAEYQNLKAMMTVLCRLPLMNEFIRPHEVLHPEVSILCSPTVYEKKSSEFLTNILVCQ